MVSLFFHPLKSRGGRPPFIGKEIPISLVYFQCGIASHKGKNPKHQNLGSTPSVTIGLKFEKMVVGH